MEPTFRASLNWMHTWIGVVLGALLFAIFWMGTLAVFDKEIDRWMAPTTRLAISSEPISLDALRPSLDAAIAGKAPNWQAILPTERQPVVRVNYRDGKESVVRYLDPATGVALPDPGTLAGSRFLYPFHYMLHIEAGRIGVWLVGLASMAMLALCVSGVIIHRKIFADFFALRVKKKSRRALLDLHNIAGVLGLPFHIAITLSGLIIFWHVYMPSGWQTTYKNLQALSADVHGIYLRPKIGIPGEIASLDNMALKAQQGWSEGEAPRSLIIIHPGDAASYVLFTRSSRNRVAVHDDRSFFDGATGTLLYRHADIKAVMTAQSFIAGLHYIQFNHWILRWLYFALGLLGCALIATGYLYWLDSRRKKHAQVGLAGVRIVEGLTVGSTIGIVIATLSFFVVNRLLPLGTTFLSYERAALEVWTFYLVWIATFAHAWIRPRSAWIEQCWASAAVAVAAVLLNWITTGDHLIRSLAHRHLWPIAGMDLLLLAGATIAVLTVRKLQRRASATPGRRVAASVAESQAAAE